MGLGPVMWARSCGTRACLRTWWRLSYRHWSCCCCCAAEHRKCRYESIAFRAVCQVVLAMRKVFRKIVIVQMKRSFFGAKACSVDKECVRV